MKLFPPHLTDFYKSGHVFQYPKGTEYVYSNWTCRSDKHAHTLKDFDHKVVLFNVEGVCQWLLRDLWKEFFFDRPKDEVVAYYKRRMDTSLGPGAVPVEHIAALHDLGYLPVLIKALPEGSRVDIRVPMFTIINTLPEFFWVTNYLETQLSCELYKSMTSATTAYEYKRLFDKSAVETGADVPFCFWEGHDFSFRGMSGITDAAQSGAGHLLSFTGTDTIHAIDYLENYYGANAEEAMVGGHSVPATEHSVMSMGGEEDEVETFRRLVEDIYPAGIVSIVSDTWDFWKVLTEYCTVLKSKILSRNGKVVFRPDSGDPVSIIVGSAEITDLTGKTKTMIDASDWAKEILVDKEREGTAHGERGSSEVEGYFKYDGQIYLAKVKIEWDRYDKQYYYVDGSSVQSFEPAVLSPEQKGAVECLWEVFGGTTTPAGYKTLDGHVGLIYGDSISLERAEAIIDGLKKKGFSSGNVVYGIGSYTYQYVTRDTFGTAIKATWGVVNGEERELFKNPKTDDGTKKSACGLIRIEYEDGKFILYDHQTKEQEKQGLLEPVFSDGKMLRSTSLTEIRKRLYP